MNPFLFRDNDRVSDWPLYFFLQMQQEIANDTGLDITI